MILTVKQDGDKNRNNVTSQDLTECSYSVSDKSNKTKPFLKIKIESNL